MADTVIGTKIQDTDIMVLQKLGDYDIDEPNKPPGNPNDPDPYPNLKYDLQLYHFTGLDLKFTVGEYLDYYHKYVRIGGDEMTGNLAITKGAANSEGGSRLTLKGYRTDEGIVGALVFKNTAWNREFHLRARLSSDTGALGSVDFDNKVAMTENGGITLRCNSAKPGSEYTQNTIVAQDLGRISYQKDHNVVSQLTIESIRYEWDEDGWTLRANDGTKVIESNDGTNNLISEGNELLEWKGDSAKYKGVITDDKHLVTKEYVDSQDGLYLPLAGGTMSGDINFVSGVGLNGLQTLHLKQNGDPYISLGGTNNDPTSGNIHFKKRVDAEKNIIGNLRFPTDTIYGVNTNNEDLHAVPKTYVDEKDKSLSDRIDNIGGIYTPTGMINAYVGDADPQGWFICNATNAAKTWAQLEADAGRPLDDLKAMLPSGIPDLSGRFLGMMGGAMGGSLKQNQSQSTAFPSTVGNTIDLTHRHQVVGADVTNAMQYAGHHMHNLHGSTGGGSAQQHTDGNRTLASGSDSNNWKSYMLPENNWAGEKTITYNGNHKHDYNNFYTQNDNLWLDSTDFDTYTRPNSYTINWIIKHD